MIFVFLYVSLPSLRDHDEDDGDGDDNVKKVICLISKRA